MSNEVSVRNNQSVGGSFNNINQGTVAVESNRAIAEAQGKLIMAKQFPRDYTKSYASAIEACQRKGLPTKRFQLSTWRSDGNRSNNQICRGNGTMLRQS